MKVLVIGDVIEDVFHYGTAMGLSAETPTIVMKRERTERSLGGAALVVRHLRERKAKKISLICTAGVKKTRFMVDGYKLFQMDEFSDAPNMSRSEFQREFCEKMYHCDTVVVADNRHGTIEDIHMARFIVRECDRYGKKLVVDSQVSQSESNHEWYKGCNVMCMNEREWMASATEFTMWKVPPGHSVFEEALTLRSQEWGCDIIVKLGDRGSVACVDCGIYWNEAYDCNVIDTIGAGDAFLSVIALEDLSADPAVVLEDANFWASRACTLPGTEVPFYNEEAFSRQR